MIVPFICRRECKPCWWSEWPEFRCAALIFTFFTTFYCIYKKHQQMAHDERRSLCSKALLLFISPSLSSSSRRYVPRPHNLNTTHCEYYWLPSLCLLRRSLDTTITTRNLLSSTRSAKRLTWPTALPSLLFGVIFTYTRIIRIYNNLRSSR